MTADAVFCPGCDFILDASFLGDDIMDVEASKRVRAAPGKEEDAAASPSGAKKKKKRSKKSKKKSQKAGKAEAGDDAAGRGAATDPKALEIESQSFGGDALILGDLDDDEIASFNTSDTGLVQREVTLARMYVGGSIQAVLMPDAIPEIAPDLDLEAIRLTPFEKHVIHLVNAKRPVARIKTKSGLADDDFQTALAMLADKGFIRLHSRAKKKRKKGKKKPPLPEVENESDTIAMPPALPAEDDDGAGEKEADNDDRPMERTLIADAPSQAELVELEPPPDDDYVFGSSMVEGAPAGDDEAGGGESTQIQELPPDSQQELDRAASAFDKESKPSLSYVDSLLSQEDDAVFASAEEIVARSARNKAPKARRRPPLPGELPADELDLDDTPLGSPDGSATGPAPPASPGSGSASGAGRLPPPLPGDASMEAPSAPGVPSDEARAEAEAVAFEDLETDVPARREERLKPSSPVQVNPSDISLAEVEPVEEPRPAARPAKPPDLPGSGLPSSRPAPGLAPPPHTDPSEGGISLSSLSDEKPAITLLPPSSPPSPAVADASGPAPAVDDSESGEGEAAVQVSFEMRRKAEKIFEQAEQDFAAGNVSSAIMNAKLAMIYDPVTSRYKQFVADWERMQKEQQSGPGAKRSREEVLVDMAQDAEARGQYEGAADYLQQALKLAPNAAAVHNRLGVLLATRLKRYKEASEHVLKAIDLNPKNLAYKNNLGKILAKEESAIHKMPQKKRGRGKKGGKGDPVVIRKIRPKLF